ncbi:MAG: alternative ribosome rescue aminoacyl-tRNA hydrolase ArfB [Gammaproteobacteria bacterium]|jgi:ribosome-associated protein
MSASKNYGIPPAACEFQFIHSSGPGGQHVNKTSTAVELRVDTTLLALDAYSLGRLIGLQANRINKQGILVVQASSHRSQLKNRQQALARVEAMIQEARQRPKKRIATSPSQSAKRKRVDRKKKHGTTKQQRQKPDW